MARPTTLREPWRSLAERLGGVGALAEALGADRRTVTRWACGDRQPSATAQIAIDALFRREGLEP